MKKNIIIVGANGGIGRKIVQRLLLEQYKCILIDSDEKINEMISDNMKIIQGDICSTDLLERLNEILKKEKNVQGIIFASGVMIPGNVSELSYEQWESTININITSIFKITKIVLPYLLKNKCSHLVAIASHLGVVGSYDLTAYSVSKAALIEFIKCIALDYGDRGLLANSVSPGFIKTNMLDAAISKFATNKKWMFATGGLPKQYVNVDDVVSAILFLINQESINGENIIIDGGYSVR